MTGTASRPVRPINSMRASVSSATFLAVNSTPWDERNSFAAWHDIQVEDQYTVTSRVVMRRPRSPRIDHPFAVPSDSFPSRPPKMCRPSLNASSTVAPAPAALGVRSSPRPQMLFRPEEVEHRSEPGGDPRLALGPLLDPNQDAVRVRGRSHRTD